MNVNTHKLNATPGPWHVSDNSVNQSPSLASDCSNNSINSTTEWNVMDSKEAPKTPVLPEAQYPGWTVTSPGSNIAVASDKVETVELRGTVSPKGLLKESKRQENCGSSKKETVESLGSKKETVESPESKKQTAELPQQLLQIY